MSIHRIALVVGHSKEFPGKTGAAPLNQHEFFYNLEVAQIAYRYVKESGVDCWVFTRNGTLDNAIEDVSDRVNRYCDGFNSCSVELHFNGFDRKQNGSLALFDAHDESCEEYARALYDDVCSLFNRDQKKKQCRGIHKVGENGYDRGTKNLTLLKCTSAIIEPFFGDNPYDAELGLKLKFEYAKLLATTSIRYLLARG